MRIAPRLHLVGSEQFGLSHRFDCNVFLVDAGGPLVLIDAGRGLDVDAIQRNVEEDGLDPSRIAAVLVTHSHDGHTAGLKAFRERWGCEIWMPRVAAPIVAQGTDPGIPFNVGLGMYPDGWTFPCVEAEHLVDDGDEIVVGEARFRAILVEGHTPDSTCFLWEHEGRRTLFTGDVVFHAGRIGLVNLPASNLDDYRRDLPKLGGLGVDALCPGHGVFTVARGQWHVDQAIERLTTRAALPPSFYETLEFVEETSG